jgi:hypothetical protein
MQSIPDGLLTELQASPDSYKESAVQSRLLKE